jgi:hypothetical protein
LQVHGRRSGGVGGPQKVSLKNVASADLTSNQSHFVSVIVIDSGI